jgi:uncharacterized protein
MIALSARPISQLWAIPLRYRRVLGVSAFCLGIGHALHIVHHTLAWNFDAVAFMLPAQQAALWAGVIALILMLPAACTSFTWMMIALGQYWRQIHLLSIPALLLGVIHTIWLGSNYLGEFTGSETDWLSIPLPSIGDRTISLRLEGISTHWLSAILLLGLAVLVLLLRLRCFWSLFSLEKYYVPPHKIGQTNR